MLTREQFAAKERPREVVAIPAEFGGGEVCVWHMDGLARITWEAKLDDLTAAEAAMQIVALCVGDESGPFGLTVEEVKALGAGKIDVVARAAYRLNVLSREAAEEQRGK